MLPATPSIDRPRGRGRANAMLTLALMVPVAVATGDHGWPLGIMTLVASCLTVLALCSLVPHGPLFALGLLTGLVVYVCLFAVVGRSAFPQAAWWAEPVGFALPLLSFVAGCWLRRRDLALVGEADPGSGEINHLPRFGAWLGCCALVGALSLGLPLNRLASEWQTAAFLLAMAGIGVISLFYLQGVLLLLAEVSHILAVVAARMVFLAAPMVTYTLLFGLVAVGFGVAYRVADGLSKPALFHRLGEAAKIDFVEAIHFSIVTLATVGYGDILPHDPGVRLLASIEMLAGQLLILFGFAEIMRDRMRK